MSGGDPLPSDERALVEVSAALGGGRPEGRDEALRTAAAEVRAGRLASGAVEEALLQAHLFLGYPATIAALDRWRALEPGGGPAEAEGRQGREADGADRRERGERLCRRIYGDEAYEKLRRRVRRLHPALDRWMVEEGYGRVLSRPGLEVRVRELCVVAVLAAADRPPQLHSHLRGALRVGASPAAVEAALEAGTERAAGPAADRARERWRRVRRRSGASD